MAPVVLYAECVSCPIRHPVAVKVIKKSEDCKNAYLWASREIKAHLKLDFHGNIAQMIPDSYIKGAGLGAGLSAGLVAGPLKHGG